MTRSRPALVSLVMLAGACAATAQPAPKPDGQWRAWLSTGFTHASGNTSATTATFKTDAVRATDIDKWILYGEGLRAHSEGVTSGNRIRLGGRYDWNLSPRLFSFGSLELERDTVAELDRRTNVGTGLGYKLIDRDDLRFSTFGGLSLTSDRYLAPRLVDGELRLRFDRPTALLGEESTHKMTASTTANQRLVISSDLDNRGAFRAQWDSNLAVAMTNTISLTVGLNLRYDSAPAPGLKGTDSLLTTGIAMKFE